MGTGKKRLSVAQKAKKKKTKYLQRKSVIIGAAKMIEDKKVLDKIRIANKRADPEYREHEKEKDRAKKQKMRDNKWYREIERKSDKVEKQRRRDDEEYRGNERERDKIEKQRKREVEEYREIERESDKIEKRLKREEKEHRELKRQRDKIEKHRKREDEEYREIERERDKIEKQRKREDEEYRETERERDKVEKQRKREDEEYRETERERDKVEKQIKRTDKSFREAERAKDRLAKEKVRCSEQGVAQKRLIDKRNKTELRNNELYRYREQYVNTLQRQEPNKYAAAKLSFIRSLSDLPTFVCSCCEGLFFRNYVVSFNKGALKTNRRINESSPHQLNFMEKISNTLSEYVCKTCHKHIQKFQIPKLSTSNGLKFVDVPSCITDLTDLEERMVSPYINFMQIRPLKPYAIHPQLSLKGSIVNIAVDVQDMLKVLPRSFSDMNVIQVKLKRHVEHKSDYMFESIRPAYVCKALKHLLNTPLYKKYDIKVDQTFFNQHELNLDASLAFIVNQEDVEQESHENQDKNATVICVDNKHLPENIENGSGSIHGLVLDRQLSDTSASETETLFEGMSLEDTDIERELAEIEIPSCSKDIIQPLIVDDDSMSSARTVPESMSIEYDSDLERALAEIEIPSDIEEDVKSTSDVESDGEKVPDDEVLVMDRNKEISDISKIQVIAPGQGKAPVPWHIVDDIDELSFPRIFGGHAFDLKEYKISYSERCKSEARRKDRRSCRPTRLLYMAKQKLEKACLSSINICLRKINRTEKLTAHEARNKELINDIMRYDAGYKVLNQVRSSPSYWESKKKHLLAMIRQLVDTNILLDYIVSRKIVARAYAGYSWNSP
ncbi:unnamed protein product [Callosobruchus maculatus]|uniref:DUF6570 domain-containing protein n=1 Tax=Callosobruchus maculatus TaxID=64391 RepID=A0A653DJI8_CALMS|nr:unnamed protein product [Callosobruchus maculatus]